MKAGKAISVFLVSIVVIIVLMNMASHSVRAQDSDISDLTVSGKLDKVLSNQQVIMNDLAAIKEDLRIMKIRITQGQ